MYSSLFPFSVALSGESLEDAAPDSTMAIVHDGYIYVCKGAKEYSMTGNGMVLSWSVPGVNVKTEITLTAKGHVRRHEIESTIEAEVYDCGFALPFDGDTVTEVKSGEIRISHNDRYASVKACRVSSVKASPNTSIAFRNSVIPCSVYEIQPGSLVIEDEFEGARL